MCEDLTFNINEFLSLRLEGKKTVIYILDKEFRQCRYLAFRVNLQETEKYVGINSIDDLVKTDRSEEFIRLNITPEEEFWGHCSNLHAWAEYGYDSRLIHSNLAFPLLAELFNAGEPKAKRALREEVAKRILSTNKDVIDYIFAFQYHKYLNNEEMETVIQEYTSEVEEKEIKAIRDMERETGMLFFREFDEEKTSSMYYLVKNRHVVKMMIMDTDISSLPPSIGMLSHLKDLRLYYNKLEGLPESIGQLQSLKKFPIRGNSLKTLPDSIGSLNSLETLNIASNNLEMLPDSISGLSSLINLNVSNNKLHSLPKSIGNLRSLVDLQLDRNNLKSLPDSFGNFASIREINLARNQLTDIPSSCARLRSLERIDLSKNSLEKFPDILFTLPNLKFAILGHNNFPHGLIAEYQERYKNITISI